MLFFCDPGPLEIYFITEMDRVMALTVQPYIQYNITIPEKVIRRVESSHSILNGTGCCFEDLNLDQFETRGDIVIVDRYKK